MDYKVINSSKELTKVEAYKMIISDANVSLGKDAEGLIINADVWVLYTTQDNKGKEIEVLSILDKEGGVYCTISETFKRHFFDIVEAFKPELVPIVVIYGTSRAGRQFVSCNIA